MIVMVSCTIITCILFIGHFTVVFTVTLLRFLLNYHIRYGIVYQKLKEHLHSFFSGLTKKLYQHNNSNLCLFLLLSLIRTAMEACNLM